MLRLAWDMGQMIEVAREDVWMTGASSMVEMALSGRLKLPPPLLERQTSCCNGRRELHIVWCHWSSSSFLMRF